MRCASIRQDGFTLLEALVTIVVISIGLLGLLGLQSVALVNTQMSQARGDATIAADNLADRIRANPAGSADGAYTLTTDTANNDSNSQSNSVNCAGSETCTPDQMAAFDIGEWQQTLRQSLPAGSGSIACNSSSGGKCVEYLIKITWSERNRSNKDFSGDETNCGTGDGVINRCFQTLVRP